MTNERRRIQELEARIRKIEREKEILKGHRELAFALRRCPLSLLSPFGLSVHRDVDAGFVLRIHLAPFDKVKGLKVETTPAVLRWLAFWFGDL